MAIKHVFVVGFPGESQANLNSFLQMTGCRVTSAKDERDAVNLMLNRKLAFRTLDLILMGNCALFMQFLDMFDGAISLSKKYKFLVIDDLGLEGKFKELFHENRNQFEVEFCSTHGLIDKFNSILYGET